MEDEGIYLSIYLCDVSKEETQTFNELKWQQPGITQRGAGKQP